MTDNQLQQYLHSESGFTTLKHFSNYLLKQHNYAYYHILMTTESTIVWLHKKIKQKISADFVNRQNERNFNY